MAQSMHMPAAEKRRLEQENLKASRIQHIIECTFNLFAEKGIESITMNEIASQAEIGVASLYRYFVTKEDLAIECAVYAWKMEEEIFSDIFSSPDYDDLTGYEQMKILLGIFPRVLSTQGNFFRFVYYFDSFVKRQSLSPERLDKYEITITSLKDIVMHALQKGREDGSINYGKSGNETLATASDDEMYFTLMHSLFALAQKLSLSGEMLYMNREVTPGRQVELLINIMLDSLHS